VLLIERMISTMNSDYLMIRKKKISKMRNQNLLLKKELYLNMLFWVIFQIMLEYKSKKYRDVVISYSKYPLFSLLLEKKKLTLSSKK